MFGLRRRQEDPSAEGVLEQVALEHLRIEAVERLNRVEDRSRRLQVEHDGVIAELQVEVEESDAPALSQRRERLQGSSR